MKRLENITANVDVYEWVKLVLDEIVWQIKLYYIAFAKKNTSYSVRFQ